MRTLVTLLLVCMISSGALSLQCYPPVYDEALFRNVPSNCSNTCASTSTSVKVYLAAGVTDLPFEVYATYDHCGSKEACANSSINIGMMKIANNTHCCSSRLCNNITWPAMPQQSLNGRKCYTCTEVDCYQKLYCEGNEDRCMSATVARGSRVMNMKGCVTNNVCSDTLVQAYGLIVTDIKCCEGNFCNGAERFTLSFLLTLIPLLSSVLFY